MQSAFYKPQITTHMLIVLMNIMQCLLTDFFNNGITESENDGEEKCGEDCSTARCAPSSLCVVGSSLGESESGRQTASP